MVVVGERLIPVHLQDIHHFHGNFWLELMLMCVCFEVGWGSLKKVYVLYTCENVDICGWSLNSFKVKWHTFNIIE